MGDHRAPLPILERWQETEPLRLYLYGVTVPMLAACVTYGWLTTEQLGAWLAVAAALFTGSTVAGELARRVVWAPRSVDLELDQQAEQSYAAGREDVDVDVDLNLESDSDAHPQTMALAALGRCRRVEHGRRCTLTMHPEGVEHVF